MGVQIFSQNLRQSANNSTAISASREERPLIVQPLSVWIVGAAMAVLKCLTLLIIILRPINVPRNPDRLARLATIFAYSRSLNAELKSQGRASDRLLRLKPRGKRFRSSKKSLNRLSVS
jgi:hypothetical protein